MSNLNIKSLIKPAFLKGFDIINFFYFQTFMLKNKNTISSHNTLCNELSGKNILILAPHIDDDVIGCGGAIIKYLEKGSNVSIVYLTNSGKQGSKSEKTGIISERKNEALDVASKLKLPSSNLYFLQGEDGDLINSDISKNLEEIIKKIKPDTIFTPCIYDTHNDHYATNEILLKVYKNNESFFNTIDLFIYETQSPLTGFYSNYAIDISTLMDFKMSLALLYKSQPSTFKFMKDLHKINSLSFSNTSYIELYLKTTFNNYQKLANDNCSNFQQYLAIKKLLIPNGDSRDLIKSFKSSLNVKVKLKDLN